MDVVLASAAKIKGYNFSIMHKTLAILALALFVFPVQAYTQTNKAQQTSKGDNQSSPVVPVVPQQRDSPKLQPEHQDHVQTDVRVISAPGKDGYDKAAFWGSFVLVGIGFGGVWYARNTLKAIEGQLAEIKAAGIQTDKMIANAGKHADAAINAARPFILVYTKGDLGTEFWMRNCGRSPAQLLHVDPIMKIELSQI